ncbi:MAG: class I SAM-dependent methyltransferase [Vicinamibacteria bacterium]
MNADKNDLRFGFGRNWEDFIRRNFSEERVDISKRHLLGFLQLSDLKGHSFLDIGCGSGIHSLAAFRSGADSVTGFDYDQNSVNASRVCHEYAGKPINWSISQGSVLDASFMENKVPKASLVYSWGVLHHTGDVWTAIRNAAGRVAPGGLFYIALYSSDADVQPSPEFWLDVKQRYNQAGWFGRQKLLLWYIWRFMIAGDYKNVPVVMKRFREHKHNRGMSLLVDIRDWLGGWPMEYVRDAEVEKVCVEAGLTPVRVQTGEACHEYLYKRVESAQA